MLLLLWQQSSLHNRKYSRDVIFVVDRMTSSLMIISIDKGTKFEQILDALGTAQQIQNFGK